MQYPPVSNMLAVQVYAGVEKEGLELSQKLAEKTRELAENWQREYDWNLQNRMQIVGPAPAGIGKINDIYRFVFYVKYGEYDCLVRVKDILEQMVKEMDLRKINIQFDFNPMNTL